MIKPPRIPDHLNAQWPYLPHQLRARDLEVARVVLKAAAKVCDTDYRTPDGWGITGADIRCAAAIRALEISHD